MNLTKKAIPILSLAVLLAGCGKEPERVERSTNPAIQVETLFRHDGCTMYRFEDGGRKHYFSRCGAVAETIGTHSELCGKRCTRQIDENITTMPAGNKENHDQAN